MNVMNGHSDFYYVQSNTKLVNRKIIKRRGAEWIMMKFQRNIRQNCILYMTQNFW